MIKRGLLWYPESEGEPETQVHNKSDVREPAIAFNRICSTVLKMPPKNQRGIIFDAMILIFNALRGNRTPGGSMATTQVTTTPLMRRCFETLLRS